MSKETRDTLLSVAAVLASGAAVLVALALLISAVGLAIPLVLHGTLVGVTLAPLFAAVLGAGLTIAALGGSAAAVVPAIEKVTERPVLVAIPTLAVANLILMAIAYEFLPEKGHWTAAKIAVSGLSAAGLVLGAVIYEQKWRFAKFVGAFFHVGLQVVVIGYLIVYYVRDSGARMNLLEDLLGNPDALWMLALGAGIIAPGLFLLAFLSRRPATG
jgi:hypothetical protein